MTQSFSSSLSVHSCSKVWTGYSPSLLQQTKNIQRCFPTLPCPLAVSRNHAILRFNKMIAGFTFGGNKHPVKKGCVFSFMLKLVRFGAKKKLQMFPYKVIQYTRNVPNYLERITSKSEQPPFFFWRMMPITCKRIPSYNLI